MSVRDALEIIEAPFATLEAFELAQNRILQTATQNQRNLYAKLPFIHRYAFLQAIAKRSVAA